MIMRWMIPALVLLAAACSVGTGRGEITGEVHDPGCEIEDPDYSMDPSFFSADVVEDRGAVADQTRARLTIRIQRGSFREGDSDGIMMLVNDANEIAREIESTGSPVTIPILAGAEAPVQMTLYLNQTCESGFPRDFWQIPALFEGYEGVITFRSIYAPDVFPEVTEIAASFDSAVFRDRATGHRSATLSGDFAFQFQRGRPAQPFP
jgi:hypothetical protein